MLRFQGDQPEQLIRSQWAKVEKNKFSKEVCRWVLEKTCFKNCLDWLFTTCPIGRIMCRPNEQELKHPIRGREWWPFGPTVQNRELLPKCEIFEDTFLPNVEDRKNGFYGQSKQRKHVRQGCLDGLKYSSLSRRMKY